MERMAWTDERVDDFAQEMREFRRETRSELREVRAELGAARGEIAGLRTDVTRFAFGLCAAFFVQLIAILVAITLGT
jgi:hypothetical protein